MSTNNDNKDIDTDIIPNKDDENTNNTADDKVLKGLYADLKSEREKRQGLQKQLDDINLRLKTDDETKLAEQGKLKELLDLREKELSESKSKISTLESKANAYDELEKQEREAAKERLGEKWDDDYNTIPIRTLRKIISTVSIPNAIGSDNGAGAFKIGISLTEVQKKDAKEKGMSEEIYKDYLKTIDERAEKKKTKFSFL